MKTPALALACVLALAGPLAGAGPPPGTRQVHKPSSYAPRHHTGPHVYGSPIGPAPRHAHGSKKGGPHPVKHVARKKGGGKRPKK